jgi:hypothetical protein
MFKGLDEQDVSGWSHTPSRRIVKAKIGSNRQKAKTAETKATEILERWSDTWGQALLLYPPRSP